MKTTLNTAMGIIYIMLATMQISQAQPNTLDPGFGDGGVLVAPNTNTLSSQDTNGILELSDGHYLGVGYKVLAGSFDTRPTLMKYDHCGIPDGTFGIDGLSVIIPPNGLRLTPLYAIELPDGKILCSGVSNSGGAVSTFRPTLFRLLPDGSLDVSYGANGVQVVQPGGVSSGYFGNMIKNEDDTIIVALGRHGNINGGTLGVGLMRTLPDGTPDDSFGTGGIRVFSFPDMGYSFAQWDQVHFFNNHYFVTRAESPDGGASYRAVIYAFNTNGNIVPTFGTNGRVQHPTILSNLSSKGLRSNMDTQGRLVISSSQRIFPNGQDITNLVFTRYFPDGFLDTNFGDNGTTIVQNTYGIEPKIISIDGDGEIFISCIVPGANATVNTSFIRLDGDGVPISGSQITLPVSNTGITALIKLDEDRWLAQAYGLWGGVMHQSQLRFSNNPIVLPTIEESGNNLMANGSGPDFQWFLDGEIIPDATESVYTPTANGTYTVQMTDLLGCQHLSNAFELTELSIAENQTASLQLIKNPVEEQLMLQNDIGVMDFEIYNLIGQRMSVGQFEHGLNSLDISRFSNGMYLLRTTYNEVSDVKRFIKQ